MKIAVVGAGIVGLCTAWALTKRGHDVIVLDRAPIGRSASAMNAGWVTPSLSTPLASPGILASGLRHAFEKDGALVIRPQMDTAWLRWLWRFRQSARPSVYRQGVGALLGLNRHTLELFDQLSNDGVQFEMEKAGILALALQDGGLTWFQQLFDELLPLGFEGGIEYLSPSEALEVDPSVGPAVRRAARTTLDRHVHPDSLLAGLHTWLVTNGVRIETGRALTRIAQHDGWELETEQDHYRVQTVVLALGANINSILAQVGTALPVVGAKGYSVTVQVEGAPVPRHPLYLMESKLGLSPLSDGVRIAGFFELPGDDDGIVQRRIDGLVRQSLPYLRGWSNATLELSTPRAGLRPSTPDSLPFLGEVPGLPGLFVATGHGMLGVTLSPASGEAIADLVENRPRPDLAPFRLEGRMR